MGLRAKLVRVYALQVLLISLAAVIGVSITYIIVQDVLTRQALNVEAAHFWSLYAQETDHPLPNTANMHGYLMDRRTGTQSRGLPAELTEMPPGFGRADSLPGRPLVHISDQGDQRLHLVFAEAQVSNLVFYFGLAPLIAVLLTVYGLLFLTYRLSHRAISPMLNLAQALEDFDFRSTDRLQIPVQPDDVDRETRLMVEALGEFSTRLEQFIERERTFTRNAGHELRTPIAVMKGSLDILQSSADAASQDQVLGRMRRAVDEMETLLATLLMLAREEDVHNRDGVSVNQVIIEELELHSTLAQNQNNRVELHEEGEFKCDAQPRVLGIIFSNLLRNALTYTQDGVVSIRLTPGCISIEDNGVGIAHEDQAGMFTAFFRGQQAKDLAAGQGLGLALVRRLTQQLNWRAAIESTQGVGTQAKIFYTLVN